MKNLKIYLFLIPVLAVAWASCDDAPEPQNTLVDGIVREYGSKKPLAGVRVRIVQVASGSPTAPLGFETLGVDTTDAAGRYHFELALDKLPDGIYLNVPQGYSPYDTERGGIIKGKQNNIAHDLDPYAYLYFHIKNVNPFNDNDRISGGYTLSGIIGEGRSFDWTNYARVLGNRYVKIGYTVRKNGLLKNVTDSVYISGRDTSSQYQVYY